MMLLMSGFRCVVVLLAGGLAAYGQGPSLPAPSGQYGIGRQAFATADPGRADSSSADPGKHRELMIYVWYPAAVAAGVGTAEYFPGADTLDKDRAGRAAGAEMFGRGWPGIVGHQIGPHAVGGAPVSERPGGFPVVLFSHGLSSTSFSYTTQIEDLVSHGYVVAAVEHTEAAGAVVFPDGHVRLYQSPVIPASAGPAKDPMQGMIASALVQTQTGADDLIFVLNALPQMGALAKAMDLKKVGAVGHSYGGTVVTRACEMDARITACVDEDGTVNPVGAYLDYPDGKKLQQPYLFVEVGHVPTDMELARMGQTRAGWNVFLAKKKAQLAATVVGSYLVTVDRPGMGHASFSDGPILNGEKDGLGNLQALQMVVRGFLDKTLKVDGGTVFDQPLKVPSGMVVGRIGK